MNIYKKNKDNHFNRKGFMLKDVFISKQNIYYNIKFLYKLNADTKKNKYLIRTNGGFYHFFLNIRQEVKLTFIHDFGKN